MTPIILASASPRRKALLASLGIACQVIPSGAEERFEGTPEEIVFSNARRKRDEVAARCGASGLVIGADTLVFLEGRPLGKPATLDDARTMIAQLSGKTHQVLTGPLSIETAGLLTLSLELIESKRQ